jgi:hypothetical protein
LGIRVKKEAVKALGSVALPKNSFKKFIISFLIISQHTFRNLKLKPSGPGLLLPSLHHITSLTSSKEKALINKRLSSSDKDWN